jgi:hypothetical protein
LLDSQRIPGPFRTLPAAWAELDRLAVGEQFAAMRQDSETPKRARRRFGGGNIAWIIAGRHAPAILEFLGKTSRQPAGGQVFPVLSRGLRRNFQFLLLSFGAGPSWTMQ